MSEQEGLIKDWDMDAAGGAGDKYLEWAENLTSDLPDNKAVMAYGIIAFCLAATTMVLYLTLD